MRAVMCGVLCLFFCAQVFAQDVSVSESDTTRTVLAAHKGKRITLRLRSGQEMTGIVRNATPALVVIGGLSGREFFDAVVPLASIEALIIRTRQ